MDLEVASQVVGIWYVPSTSQRVVEATENSSHNTSVYSVSVIFDEFDRTLVVVASIGVDFGGQPEHVAPNNRETPMHLSLFTTFCPQYFGLPTQHFWQVYASGSLVLIKPNRHLAWLSVTGWLSKETWRERKQEVDQDR